MGDFRITVEAVGNHGCSRDIKDGETVEGCGDAGCMDCIAREFIANLKNHGASIAKAELEHWPSAGKGPIDNLITGVRQGSF